MQKNSLKNIKGIIFDLDGTLYHMKWYMKPIMTLLMFPNILRLPKYMKIRKQFSNKEMPSHEELMNSVASKLGNNKENMKNWIERKFYPSFIKSLYFLKGSRPKLNKTLETLKNSNIKLAVLSDFAYVNERLNILDIDQNLFDITISSETEGALKPSPKPFNTILQRWNLSPEEILIVGDRDDTDGEAANITGMNFLKISDKKDEISNSWENIRKILLKL